MGGLARAAETVGVMRAVLDMTVACARKRVQFEHRIFGAIGFTMEHDLHLYHRRALANDPILGNSDFHYEQIAGGLGL